NYCLYRLRDETDEEHLGKLNSQIKGKESEIHSLKKTLDCLVAENRKLEERIMSISSLEFTFRAASRMFHGMKLNPCDVTKLMSFDDPLDTLTAFPDSAVRTSKNLVLSNLCESGQVIMGSWIASRFLGSESKDLWWSEEELGTQVYAWNI
ncbi:hypothetical protein IGI04_010162, partial [Brassica rapa subsp. trilocularis]